MIDPGQSRSVGYCAKRGVHPPPTWPANITGSFTWINDWGGGWCARPTIVNSGAAPAFNWAITLPMPATGNITGCYNAQCARSGDALTRSAPPWQPELAPGEIAANV